MRGLTTALVTGLAVAPVEAALVDTFPATTRRSQPPYAPGALEALPGRAYEAARTDPVVARSSG